MFENIHILSEIQYQIYTKEEFANKTVRRNSYRYLISIFQFEVFLAGILAADAANQRGQSNIKQG